MTAADRGSAAAAQVAGRDAPGLTGADGRDLPTGASLRKDGRPRPFDRILIANRGEIAVRILRAARELGMDVVAVYSDADAGAAHVRMADEAVRIGPAPAAESYLRVDAIVEAAIRTGAQAIHPGYGFLAERASFASAVEGAGIAFVGPPSSVIERLGDKLAARRIADAVAVPVVPGTRDPAPVDRADRLDEVVAMAREIGFPLLVKAAAGGGGRGMRRVTRLDDLPASLVAGSSEAAAAFGDGSVYLERELRPARHIEVQLLADAHGTVVALGERDCSLQRRHQKLVEESPAPGLSTAERLELHGYAIRLAEAAGLVNAATAEFLFDGERRFAFLEVNTRLQVEHGVTELVAGVDLVAEQFWVAAGRRLSDPIREAALRAASPARHAIEVRIAAEDPAHGFAPAPGRVGRWRMPEGPGVRVDSAVSSGERIPPDYDPMIAKVLVVDEDRPRAIDRLRRALDEVEISGVQTTLPFHRFVAGHEAFRAGLVSTDWVDDHWTPALDEHRASALDLARSAAVWAVTDDDSRDGVPGSGAALGDAGSRGSGNGGVSLRKDSADRDWVRSGREAAMDRWPR